MILSTTEAAYIAGLVDADGCIQVSKRQRKEVSTTQYTLEVSVSNNDINIINYIQRIVGGGAYEILRHEGTKSIVAYSYVASGKLAQELLMLIESYLISKQKEAILGIEFQNLKVNKQGVKYTYEQNVVFDYIYWQMRELKQTRKPTVITIGGG